MKDASNEIDLLIEKFFRCFDNRSGNICSFEAFNALFVQGAKIGKRSVEGFDLWSLSEFWEPREELLTAGRLCDFHEWEVEAKTSIVHGLAFRQSLYRKDGLLDNRPYRGEGVKFFQLALMSGSWYITHMLWEDG